MKNAIKSSFVIEIISNPISLKRWSGAKIYPLPALLTPLPLIPFTDKENPVCTNAKGANKAPRDILDAFHVLLFQEFHQLIHPNLPYCISVFFNSFIAFEVKLLTYPGKLPLAKGIATFVSAFFLN